MEGLQHPLTENRIHVWYSSGNNQSQKDTRMSEKQPDLPEWITTTEAAELTGLQRDTIAEYCRRYDPDSDDNKLICQKRGRDWWVSSASALKLKTTNRGRPRTETND